MTTQWVPYEEPIQTTLVRTITIAVVAGLVLARFSGGLSRWPVTTVLMLWPSFGGHWVDLWFLNWLRPRMAPSRGTQVAARLSVWFASGTVLALGMALTATTLGALRPSRWPALWWGGFAFIGIELVAHLALQLRGRASFYNGRG